LYTVLVEGDDLDEPISDAARSILDGHVVLSRRIATRGHYPAVDVLESVSRVRNEVISPGQKLQASRVLEWMAVYRESEDLINIGAYQKGSNPKVDESIGRIDKINAFLRQDINEPSAFEMTLSKLSELTGKE
jgi:flagellum-specific ATP synthase